MIIKRQMLPFARENEGSSLENLEKVVWDDLKMKPKLEAEKLVENWVAEDQDRRALIIRPTVIFGPRNKGNVYRLIRLINSGFYVPVGKGDNIKSIAYVENLVDATLFLMEKKFNGFEIYNYSDEPHISFRETVALIYRLLE